MFTVKATYGRSGETRKFTFNSLPTFDQLYTNLYRVFPISQGATLSKLLFSPDASKAGTVLIAREVHSQDQYSACTAAYAANSTGLLRFTVFEAESLPAGFVADTPQPLQGEQDVTSTATLQPQHHQHVPQSATAGQPCCAVNQAKLEMHEMVSKFKDDLDRLLQSPALTPAPPAHIPLMPPASSFCLFKYCTTCAKIFQGPWYACEKCNVVICPGCHEKENGPQFCIVAAMGPHTMKKEVCAACPQSSTATPTVVVPSWPHLPPPPPPPLPLPAQWTPPQHWTPPQQQGYTPAYPFGAATPTPINSFGDLPRGPAAAPAVRPVVHLGVVCDICDKVIEGIRHKCLDCSDFDLCTQCIDSGSAERHNPFHEFLEIKEPGRVIVHNVYSGAGERDAPASGNTRAPPPPAPPVEAQPVVHYATCNLCDSRIRGDRYKCQDCPDWDSCGTCFSIIREQHPAHAFVRLSKPSDFIRHDARAPPMHLATCNGCSKTIYGIRYKCLHPTCADTDLCENCEALPIPVHPANHPLLKMRSPTTVIPTVYKVGHTTMIDRAPSPAPVPPPKPRNLMSSFGQGYMMNPNARSNTMPASFFDSPPITPPRQPSPFFFKSESSRSVSPFGHMEYRGRSVSPPYVPRPLSPVMMPGGLYDEPAFARQPQPIFATRPYNHVQAAVSRFSHSPSPSPSPPLFSQPQRSPSPVRPSRQATWAGPSLERRESFLRTLQLEETLSRQRREAVDQLVEAHKSLEQHVEQQQLRWGAPAAVPVPEPALPSFWPKSSDELRHLMRSEYEPRSIAFSQPLVQEEPAVMDSPLTGEAMLNHPDETSQTNKTPVTFTHSLAALLNGYESENEIEKVQESEDAVPASVAVSVPASVGLRATFLDDITLPDGQIFPPGAEFVKCWRMVNSGGEDWPVTTELVWIAGERLARGPGTPANVPIGMVKVGGEIDLWTGELKAPEVPGRYVSYWRLRDDQGNAFGDNIWIEYVFSCSLLTLIAYLHR
ncbi:hypothetical protein C8F01DRAFT_1107742 [Mycena amicta]|nr:hypothetical protein C8F01DRAFT_1107742 [Mycena amicta]